MGKYKINGLLENDGRKQNFSNAESTAHVSHGSPDSAHLIGCGVRPEGGRSAVA